MIAIRRLKKVKAALDKEKKLSVTESESKLPCGKVDEYFVEMRSSSKKRGKTK